MGELPAFESSVPRTHASDAGVPFDADRPGAIPTLSDLSSTTKTILKAGRHTDLSRRIAVPFGTSRSEGDVLVTGQRPDEWILLGPAAATQVLIDNLDRSGHVSVIDCTHSRALFRLTGADTVSVLEKLCSLDWCDHMTPDGAAVSTSVARVTCDIVRNDLAGTRSYLISCDRSFGQYLFGTILDAGQEFGTGPLVEPVA